MIEHDPDVVAITETWLDSSVTDDTIVPPSYVLYRKDRESKVVKSCLNSSEFQIEYVWCSIKIKKSELIVGVLYRHPQMPCGYVQELSEFLFKLKVSSKKVVLKGDFNLSGIDRETLGSGDHEVSCAEELLDIVFSDSSTQIVNGHTRIQGQSEALLDLIFIIENLINHAYHYKISPVISDRSTGHFTCPQRLCSGELKLLRIKTLTKPMTSQLLMNLA